LYLPKNDVLINKNDSSVKRDSKLNTFTKFDVDVDTYIDEISRQTCEDTVRGREKWFEENLLI